MESQVSPSPAPVVTEPELARVLLDPARRRFLTPFFGRALTVGEAAAELVVKPNSLLYQVRRLVHLGLLTVVGVEPRAGRAVKRYRAEERLFVPFATTDAETLEALLLRTGEPHARRFARNLARALLDTPEGTMGYLVGRHARGEVDAYFSPDGVQTLSLLEPGAPAAGRSWVVLSLSHEDAKALQREQWALWERYLGKRGSGRYLAHFDLTPWLED